MKKSSVRNIVIGKLTLALTISALQLFGTVSCHAFFKERVRDPAAPTSSRSRAPTSAIRSSDAWVEALVQNQGGRERFLRTHAKAGQQVSRAEMGALILQDLTAQRKYHPFVPVVRGDALPTYRSEPLPTTVSARDKLQAALDEDNVEMADIILTTEPAFVNYSGNWERRRAYHAARDALHVGDYWQAFSVLMDPRGLGYRESLSYTVRQAILSFADECLHYIRGANILELSNLLEVLGRADLIRPLSDALHRGEARFSGSILHLGRYNRTITQFLQAFNIRVPQDLHVAIPDESPWEDGEPPRPPYPAEVMVSRGWDAESHHAMIEDLDAPVVDVNGEHPLTKKLREDRAASIAEKQRRNFAGTAEELEDHLKQSTQVRDWVRSLEPTHLMRWSDSQERWVPAKWSDRQGAVVSEGMPNFFPNPALSAEQNRREVARLAQEWGVNATEIWPADSRAIWEAALDDADPTLPSEYLWDMGHEKVVAWDIKRILAGGIKDVTDLYYISDTGERVFFERFQEPDVQTYIELAHEALPRGPHYFPVPNYYYMSAADGLAHFKQHREGTLDIYRDRQPDGTLGPRYYFMKQVLSDAEGGGYMIYRIDLEN